VGPILADAGLRLVGAVYLVASLSFLGLVPLGGQNWASMVADNADAGGLNTAALLAPGLCIVAFAVSINLLGDRLAARLRGQR
jgi:ABC-type dipeptide/oligopeptide/nickel transport system permease subunit